MDLTPAAQETSNSTPADDTALSAGRREAWTSLRKLELVLLLGIAVGPYLLTAIYVYLYNAPMQESSNIQFQLTHGITHQVGSLALLVYVLFRQKRSLRDIGLSFRWLDIPVSLALYAIAYFAYYLAYIVLYYSYLLVTGRLLKLWDDMSQIMGYRLSIAVVIFILINPFFEELIVRAYTMTELSVLSNNFWLPATVSVGIQALYHVYQGLPNALLLTANFAVFALYYAKSRRILPVILAHLYMDILSTAYLFHHR